MKPVHELARGVAEGKLRGARSGLEKLTPAERRRALREGWAAALGDVEPNTRPEAVSRWTKSWASATVEGITLEVEPGIVVPVLILKPAAVEGRPPVVVALSQGGKEHILELRRGEIEALLRAGVAVCLPDLRGTGETSPDPRRGPAGEANILATTHFMLGGTLLGARLKDLRTVLAYLAARGDLDSSRTALWGDSPAAANPDRFLDETPNWQIGPDIQHQPEPMGALLAILGALYEDRVRAVAARGGLAGYLALLGDRFLYAPNDAIVPGFLETGDVADAIAAIAPRAVLLAASVDGRNRLVPESSLQSWFAPRESLEMRPDAADVGAWLAARLQ